MNFYTIWHCIMTPWLIGMGCLCVLILVVGSVGAGATYIWYKYIPDIRLVSYNTVRILNKISGLLVFIIVVTIISFVTWLMGMNLLKQYGYDICPQFAQFLKQ